MSDMNDSIIELLAQIGGYLDALRINYEFVEKLRIMLASAINNLHEITMYTNDNAE